MKEYNPKDDLVDLLSVASKNQSFCRSLPTVHADAPEWISNIIRYVDDSGRVEDAGGSARLLFRNAHNARQAMLKQLLDDEWRIVRSVIVEAAAAYAVGGSLYLASQISNEYRMPGNLIFWPSLIATALIYRKHVKGARAARLSAEGDMDSLLNRIGDATLVEKQHWVEAAGYCKDRLRELTSAAASNNDFYPGMKPHKFEPREIAS